MKITVFLIISFILCLSLFSGCDESYTYLSTKPTEEQEMPDITAIIGNYENEDNSIIDGNINDIINNKTEEIVYQYGYINCVVNGTASLDTIFVTPDEIYTEELGTVVAVKMEGIWKLGFDSDERIMVVVDSIEDGTPVTINASDIIKLEN